MQLIIDTADTSLSVKDKCFFIENKSIKRQISPKRIESIAITTNCTLNAAVIKLAANHQVPILFFNNFGTLQARMWSPYFVNIAELRKKQMIFSESVYATDWIIHILGKKTIEQITTLKHFAGRKAKLIDDINITIEKIQEIFRQTESIRNVKIDTVRNQLMGYEGSISRHYFKAINKILPENFCFEKRSRQPAMDYFNASLNYLYGMTYSVVESGVFAKGLDPFIGILHTDLYSRPTLVFDLIEPIRPLIDRILLELILDNKLTEEHFIKKEQGYWVSKKGKRIIIPSFNNYLQNRIKRDGTIKRLKDHIYSESNLLGNLIDETIELI